MVTFAQQVRTVQLVHRSLFYAQLARLVPRKVLLLKVAAHSALLARTAGLQVSNRTRTAKAQLAFAMPDTFALKVRLCLTQPTAPPAISAQLVRSALLAHLSPTLAQQVTTLTVKVWSLLPNALRALVDGLALVAKPHQQRSAQKDISASLHLQLQPPLMILPSKGSTIHAQSDTSVRKALLIRWCAPMATLRMCLALLRAKNAAQDSSARIVFQRRRAHRDPTAQPALALTCVHVHAAHSVLPKASMIWVRVQTARQALTAVMLVLMNLPGSVQPATGAPAVLMLLNRLGLIPTKRNVLQTLLAMQAFARSDTTVQKDRKKRLLAKLAPTQRPLALPCASLAPPDSSALPSRTTLSTNHAVQAGSALKPRKLKRSALLEPTAAMTDFVRRRNALLALLANTATALSRLLQTAIALLATTALVVPVCQLAMLRTTLCGSAVSVNSVRKAPLNLFRAQLETTAHR